MLVCCLQEAVTVLGRLLAHSAEDPDKSLNPFELVDDQLMNLIPGFMAGSCHTLIANNKMVDKLMSTTVQYLDSQSAWQQFAQNGLPVLLLSFCQLVPLIVQLFADHSDAWMWTSAGPELAQTFHALGQASMSCCSLQYACSIHQRCKGPLVVGQVKAQGNATMCMLVIE